MRRTAGKVVAHAGDDRAACQHGWSAADPSSVLVVTKPEWATGIWELCLPCDWPMWAVILPCPDVDMPCVSYGEQAWCGS